jgi:hypothetical protein
VTSYETPEGWEDGPEEWVPPEDWVDPRDNPDLPWIEHPTDDDLAEHEAWLAGIEQSRTDEPETVEVADHGQNEHLPFELQPHAQEFVEGARGRVAPGVGGIDLTNYSRNPQQRGFGAPCKVQLAAIQLTNVRLMVHVALAELQAKIMRANEAQGYLYRAGDTGSYNCRNVGGTSVYSWHAWSVATDSNWKTNPQRRPVTTDRPRWELDRWNRFGYAWGGDYTGSSVPDAMHTEAMFATVQIPALLALAAAELDPIIGGMPSPTPAPAPLPIPTDQARTDEYNLRDTGFDPGPVDGTWDASSTAACKRFQFAARISVDGVCGPDTRGKLKLVPSWHGAPDRAGDGGYSALRWQQALKSHGWRIETDNVWGPHATSILRQFQAEKGITADGVRGPQSWTTLFCTVN